MTWRRLLTIAVLTAAWCALWGDVSIANVVSGAFVATAGVVIAGSPTTRGTVGVGALVRFSALVAADLAASTWHVAREVVTPTDRTDEMIVEVAVPTQTRTHLVMLIIAVTVTPGTAVIDLDRERGVLVLHVLHRERVAATSAHVGQLAALACRAFPVVEQEAAR